MGGFPDSTKRVTIRAAGSGLVGELHVGGYAGRGAVGLIGAPGLGRVGLPVHPAAPAPK
jgi:hypothetical protein